MFRSSGWPATTARQDRHETEAVAAAPQPGRRAPRILVTPFEQEGENRAVPGLCARFHAAGDRRADTVQQRARLWRRNVREVRSPPARRQRARRSCAVDFVLSGTVSLWEDNFAVDLLLQETESLRYLWTERFVRKLAPDTIHVLRDEVAAIVAQRLAQPYGVLFSRALDDEGESRRDALTATMPSSSSINTSAPSRRTGWSPRAASWNRRSSRIRPSAKAMPACRRSTASTPASCRASPSELRQHADRAMHARAAGPAAGAELQQCPSCACACPLVLGRYDAQSASPTRPRSR